MPYQKVMGKYKRGQLHSGSKKGPKVKSRKQAIAIMLSEKRHGVTGSGPFSNADIIRGYKVEYTANDLAKMDYEANPTKASMARRISPKNRGKCE